MFRKGRLGVIAIFVTLLGYQSIDAYGQSYITASKCDTATVNGRAMSRITFTVHNYSPNIVISEITGNPVTYQTPGDTCQAIQVVGPSGWIPVSLADRGPGWATSTNFIYPGQTLEGFSLILSRGTCCFTLVMSDQFFQAADVEHICLTCPLTTPARTSTWGHLKVVYR